MSKEFVRDVYASILIEPIVVKPVDISDLYDCVKTNLQKTNNKLNIVRVSYCDRNIEECKTYPPNGPIPLYAECPFCNQKNLDDSVVMHSETCEGPYDQYVVHRDESNEVLKKIIKEKEKKNTFIKDLNVIHYNLLFPKRGLTKYITTKNYMSQFPDVLHLQYLYKLNDKNYTKTDSLKINIQISKNIKKIYIQTIPYVNDHKLDLILTELIENINFVANDAIQTFDYKIKKIDAHYDMLPKFNYYTKSSYDSILDKGRNYYETYKVTTKGYVFQEIKENIKYTGIVRKSGIITIIISLVAENCSLNVEMIYNFLNGLISNLDLNRLETEEIQKSLYKINNIYNPNPKSKINLQPQSCKNDYQRPIPFSFHLGECPSPDMFIQDKKNSRELYEPCCLSINYGSQKVVLYENIPPHLKLEKIYSSLSNFNQNKNNDDYIVNTIDTITEENILPFLDKSNMPKVLGRLLKRILFGYPNNYEKSEFKQDLENKIDDIYSATLLPPENKIRETRRLKGLLNMTKEEIIKIIKCCVMNIQEDNHDLFKSVYFYFPIEQKKQDKKTYSIKVKNENVKVDVDQYNQLEVGKIYMFNLNYKRVLNDNTGNIKYEFKKKESKFRLVYPIIELNSQDRDDLIYMNEIQETKLQQIIADSK